MMKAVTGELTEEDKVTGVGRCAQANKGLYRGYDYS